MSTAYVFTIHPTFTQGLILGQLSILLLLYFILKYLFLDSSGSAVEHTFQPAASLRKPRADVLEDGDGVGEEKDMRTAEGDRVESADWFNMLLRQVVQTYRSKLRDDLPGPEGDEIARSRIEEYINKVRPAGFFDPIKINSVDLGISAPRLSHARLKPSSSDKPTTNLKAPAKLKSKTSLDAHPEPSKAEFTLTYTDTISISLSTACLFNYPFQAFARLPVSLVIELVLFESPITLTPPSPTHPSPTLTISLPPYPSSPSPSPSSNPILPQILPGPGQGFTLNLKTTSLLGSRAKLSNVQKVEELIEMQVRKLLAERGTWKVVLPGIATVQEAKEELRKEKAEMGLS